MFLFGLGKGESIFFIKLSVHPCNLYFLTIHLFFRNENVADMLMDAYPQAVGEINNAAGTPLHLACCESNASPTIVENIIQMQLTMDVSFNKHDRNG